MGVNYGRPRERFTGLFIASGGGVFGEASVCAIGSLCRIFMTGISRKGMIWSVTISYCFVGGLAIHARPYYDRLH